MGPIRWIVVGAACALLGACEGGSSEPQATAPVAVTAVDVHGRWQIEPSAYRNAAYNVLLNQGASPSEIERRVETVAETLGRNPPDYTLNADGTFTARGGGMTVSGSWTLESDVLTLSDTGGTRTRRFRVQPGLLTSIAEQEGARTVTMIRR